MLESRRPPGPNSLMPNCDSFSINGKLLRGKMTTLPYDDLFDFDGYAASPRAAADVFGRAYELAYKVPMRKEEAHKPPCLRMAGPVCSELVRLFGSFLHLVPASIPGVRSRADTRVRKHDDMYKYIYSPGPQPPTPTV